MTVGFRGQLKEYEPLARYTSWRVGGASRHFYKPADIEDLAFFLQSLPKNEELTWLGLGSNVLIRDGGLQGTVIFTLGCLNHIELIQNNLTIRAEAGITCAKLAKFAAKHGYSNSTFFAGIPGTVGGALRMNAGAFGGQTWERVAAVETMDRCGTVRVRSPEDYRIDYRSVIGPQEEWFVAGHFLFPPCFSVARLQDEIRNLLHQRSTLQPIGIPSCGSVFKNPSGDHAGRLIESAGLKNMRIGGALVSDKHANFILNRGSATAADIEALISLIADRVERLHHIRLIPEVHIIGEKIHGNDI
jgi:UDP-N-acetylmuramate dehydrogenase